MHAKHQRIVQSVVQMLLKSVNL